MVKNSQHTKTKLDTYDKYDYDLFLTQNAQLDYLNWLGLELYFVQFLGKILWFSLFEQQDSWVYDR